MEHIWVPWSLKRFVFPHSSTRRFSSPMAESACWLFPVDFNPIPCPHSNTPKIQRHPASERPSTSSSTRPSDLRTPCQSFLVCANFKRRRNSPSVRLRADGGSHFFVWPCRRGGSSLAFPRRLLALRPAILAFFAARAAFERRSLPLTAMVAGPWKHGGRQSAGSEIEI